MSAPVETALAGAARWVSGVVAELGRAPWPVALGVAGAGAVVLLVGARARRPLAVVGAAAIGAVASSLFAPRLLAGSGIPATTVTALLAAGSGAIAVVVPQVFPALAGALPGAILAEAFSPDAQRLQVAAAGAALGAVAGVLLSRFVASAVAGLAGALAVTVGVASALRDTGAGRALARHPSAILAVTVVLGVAGAAFQLSRAWGRGAAPVKGEPERG